MLTCSEISLKQLWSLLAGRNGPLFSVWHGLGKLSMGYGSRMLQSLILIDVLSSACWEKKKKKRKEIAMGIFSQGQRPDMLCSLGQVGFLWLLGAIKGGVKHQSLNFYLYLM
jgi:hypothetical protein